MRSVRFALTGATQPKEHRCGRGDSDARSLWISPSGVQPAPVRTSIEPALAGPVKHRAGAARALPGTGAPREAAKTHGDDQSWHCRDLAAPCHGRAFRASCVEQLFAAFQTLDTTEVASNMDFTEYDADELRIR